MSSILEERNMSIFERAEQILAPLDVSSSPSTPDEEHKDWVQEQIPPDNYRVNRHWKFAFHPPTVPIRDGMYACVKCGCLVARLKSAYKSRYTYWCLHCGPQEEVHFIDR